MDNDTSWVMMEVFDNQTASTSTLTPPPEGNTSAVIYRDSIVSLLDNTSMVVRGTTTDEELIKPLNIWNVFEELPWLIWVIVGLGVLTVIAVVAAIITCIVWNKKRVIRRRSASDIRIVGPYDSMTRLSWPRWMICCGDSPWNRREDLKVMRQNSASNLDPYKRPPLPPINADRQHLTVDGYQGSYVPPQRLAPIRQEDISTPSHQTQLNNNHLIHNNIQQDELFGIQIAGIKGVPVIEVREDQRRKLPTPVRISTESSALE